MSSAREAAGCRCRWSKSRTELLDLAVTYGLTAIGLCLMLGLLHAAGVPGRGGVPDLGAADAAALADDLSAAPRPWSATP